MAHVVDLCVKGLHEPYHLDQLSDSEVGDRESEVEEEEDDRSVASEELKEEEEGTDLGEEDSEAKLEAN